MTSLRAISAFVESNDQLAEEGTCTSNCLQTRISHRSLCLAVVSARGLAVSDYWETELFMLLVVDWHDTPGEQHGCACFR